MNKPLPTRPTGDLSPATVILVLLYFLIVMGLGFWARGEATAIPGPGTIKQSEQGDVYVQVGTELLRITPEGIDVRRYDLARLGVEKLFDFVLLGGEKILVRLGPYRKSFLENLATYLRLPNSAPVSGAPDGAGLYTCDLAVMSCTVFSRNFDMDDVHWLAYDREAGELFIADTSRHQIHKLGADGALRATQASDFIFPNHISLVDGRLRVIDTNNRAVKLVNGHDEPFGARVSEAGLVNSDVRGQGHGFPYMLAEVGNEYWVLIMNRNMARGGVYRYAKDWRYLGRVALPEVENADYIAPVGEGAWVSDGSGLRVVQLAASGTKLGELNSPGFLQRMTENGRSHDRWMGFAHAMAGLFGVSLVAGVIVGLRRESKRASALDNARYERVVVNLADPEIHWIEVNPSVRRRFYLLAGLMLIMPVILLATMVGSNSTSQKPFGLWPALLAVTIMLVAVGAVMFQMLRNRIGVLGDVLILQHGKEHRAARGKSIVYSGMQVAIDNIIVPLGSGAMPLYRIEEVVARLHPLIQNATVVGMREMQVYQLRHMKKTYWALTAALVFLAVLVIVIR